MDIFPSSVNTIINHHGVTVLSQKIQNLEYIDLAEKAIRALERISSEAAHSVLTNANLDIILNMMDFFELDVQICILKMISNVCMNLNREEDIEKLKSLLPALTNFLEIRGTSDKHSELFNLTCTSFQFMCDAPLKFKDAYNNLDFVSDYFKSLNTYGLMEKIYQFLASACTSSRFFSESAPESESDQEDSRVQIIISNLGKLTRIMFYLCKYSSDHCVTAITDMNILNIIEKLLKREGSRVKSASPALSETLSLLGALIPDSKSYKNDDSDYAKNEKNKSIVFDEQKGEVNDYRNTLVKSILPSMFKLYVSTFNQNLKFTFLQLIEEIILMLSGETLREHMQPYLFSRFVITTMKSDNYTWIEICLRIMQLLTDKKVNNCNLALQREGIKDYLNVYSDKDKFKELTGITITDEEEKVEAQDLFGDGADLINMIKASELQQPVGDTQDKSLNEPKGAEEPKVVELQDNEDESDKPVESKQADQTEEVKKEIDIIENEKKDTKEQKKELADATTPTKPEVNAQATEDTAKIDDDFHTPESAPKVESSSLSESKDEEEKKEETSASLSVKVDQLKDQKEYLDDLKLAIKESMNEIEGMSKDIDDTDKSELEQEELTLQKDVKQVDPLDSTSSDPNLSQRKIKKMFIKRAIQNLDDNLEGMNEIGGFEEGEIEKIKDIIAKKRILLQGKAAYTQEARKYSRDFIGMNTAPMYKNIVSISKKLLTSFEENLNEEFDKDAKILERLNTLAQTLMDESKNARNFDRGKTIEIFKNLTSFFEGDNNSTKITQYELCKSKLVHALHSFLSLPLKEEESKSQGKVTEKASSKDSEEYLTIMSRYL